MKNSKKFIMQNVLLCSVLLMALLFVFASCKNDEPGTKTTNLVAFASDGDNDSQKHALNISITGEERSAGRAIKISNGSSYELKIMGISLSKGTVSVLGTDYTFTPSEGEPFMLKLNAAAGDWEGTIKLTDTAKQAIKTATGLNITIETLNIYGLGEELAAGDSRWNGTWELKQYDGKGNIYPLNRRLVFSGNTYRLYNGAGSTVAESGTFVYFDPQATPGVDSMFIFYRTGQTPATAYCQWEGSHEPETLPNGDIYPPWLEFTYSFTGFDPMKLTRGTNDVDSMDDDVRRDSFWFKQ
jgi:hypothetical protein